MSPIPETRRLAEKTLTLSRRLCASSSQYGSELTESGFLVLDCLAEAGTASVGDLQEQVGVVPAQMFRLVRQLQTSGFVTSGINREDRRRIDMAITGNGRAAHATYQEARLAPIIAALERLREDERSQFMVLIRKMLGNDNDVEASETI